MSSLSSYFAHSSPITWMVLLILSFYFIATFWIFIYRYRLILQRLAIESRSLTRLYMGRSEMVSDDSLLAGYLRQIGRVSPEVLKAAVNDAVRSATRGLTQLSIMASTSPFIGLFGTVVGILEAFGRLGTQKSASLSVVAPAISEALIATAAGIFVAVFAYAFHLLLKRKAYELQSLLESQSEIVLAQTRKER
ncbi:MotA/TolQ/ExbB proton channel family protein [Nitratifractor salsuginis]|uniref:Cell division and transport-associated protein TolQ n=1 Tax=Nitratifractor salsuginis (strain DSM 16511 / JCM 12458 / E9I37-1) TaxID=749222 RepID=E6X0D0_NITSE|nr:MotA/TolQ/ExbB proton channel family protein [Nitratifractor salsuginis]ADV45719.1 Cell division and transport-associated protein TolQ [Nitratifractor salsuginis DSM 16511]